MTTLRRALVLLVAAFLVALGLENSADAQTGTSTVTQTLANLQNQIDDLADDIDNIDNNGGNSQEQTQEQNQNLVLDPRLVRVSATGGGGSSKLPKTGSNTARVGGMGTASLLIGLSLMEFARRRRSHWLSPAGAPQAAVPVNFAPVDIAPSRPVEVAPSTPARAGQSEADLLLPYADGPVASMPTPVDPDDIITPGF